MGKTHSNKLSVKAVAGKLVPGRHGDGGGLYLQVTATGGKSWLFLYRWDGKQKEMGLGSAAVVGLAQARELARVARLDVESARNPLDARRERERAEQARMTAEREVPTFETFGRECIDGWAHEWKNPKSAHQWVVTITKYCEAIKAMRVSDIDTVDVLKVLRPIWSTIAATAKKVRERIERILDAAKVAGFRAGENPARWRGHLALILPKRRRDKKKHHAALPFNVVANFIADLRGIERTRLQGDTLVRDAEQASMSALALEFTILTAARTTEVRMARQREFDLDARIWTVPPARMKNSLEHRIPLSDRAVAILREVWRLSNNPDAFVFKGSSKTGCLSQSAMDMCKRGLIGMTATVHGFRTSFRNWAKEQARFNKGLEIDRELAELCLSHRVGDESEQAYSRGDALELRRPIMQAWADYIEPKPRDALYGA